MRTGQRSPSIFGNDSTAGRVHGTVRTLARSIVACLLALALAGCSPAPSATPAETPNATPTEGPAAPTTPLPTETNPPEPSIGPELTLHDLDASFAYAVCQALQCDVHVIDTNGVDTNVTNTPEVGAEEHQPVFSPDGRRVTFRCPHVVGQDLFENANDDICVANVDGSHRRDLTNNQVADYSSGWSPEGKWIAFASSRGTGPDLANDIYVMAPDGSHIRRVTESVGIDEYPVWAPNGLRIAYSCTAGGMHPTGVGDFEACVVTADGSDRRRITNTPGICHPLDWSPDSSTLVIGCDPDGNGPLFDDLYLVGAGGGAMTRLTWTVGFGAKFTPDGESVIYKDLQGALWRLALDRSVRSPIQVPHVEADWDIHFGG